MGYLLKLKLSIIIAITLRYVDVPITTVTVMQASLRVVCDCYGSGCLPCMVKLKLNMSLTMKDTLPGAMAVIACIVVTAVW